MTIDEIITHFTNVKPTSSGYKALCPVHGDHDPSLCIGIGHTGNVVMDCKSHHCAVSDIVAAVGLKVSDLFNSPAQFDRWKRTQPPETKPPIVYKYLGYDGTLLYEVCRFEPKDFRQRVPDGITPNGRKWGLHGTARVLYHLPELKHAIDTSRLVFLCEGEKDTDNLINRLKLPATTSGCAGKWTDIFTQQITGAHVVMLPDNDEPGRTFMQGVAQRIHGVVASLRIVHLPNLPHKGDVTDWLASSGTVEQLNELIDAVPLYEHDDTAELINIGTLEQNDNQPNETDDEDHQIKFELSEPMRKVLHGMAAYLPQCFNKQEDPLYLEALGGRGMPLQEAASLFVKGNDELKSCERVFMFAQFHERHIPNDLLMKIRTEGAEKDPVITYSLHDILNLDIPEPEFLPVLGEDGSKTKIFSKGLSHCITAAPSGYKTHFVAQSAMHWHGQPVIYCCEEGISVWHYRIRKYIEAGLPLNANLRIVPALGEGHSFIMDTINASEPGSVVIVDTLRAFCGVEDEADGAQWAFAIDPWCLAARRRNITFIMIHHSRKGTSGKDPIENASGSNSLMSRVEQRITINKVGEHIEIFGQAKNWQIEPSSWKREGDRLISMTPAEVKEARNQPMAVILTILEFDKSKSIAQIQASAKDKAVDMKPRTIQDNLARLAKQGHAINDAPVGLPGKWRRSIPTLENINEDDGE